MSVNQSAQLEWARRGASARLAEIDDERAAILRAFPGLRGIRTQSPQPIRRRRRPSASARKRMSEGMRKYWARRKAQAKAQAKD
jgi:hypothetical protein